jgi:hypothetical protein
MGGSERDCGSNDCATKPDPRDRRKNVHGERLKQSRFKSREYEDDHDDRVLTFKRERPSALGPGARLDGRTHEGEGAKHERNGRERAEQHAEANGRAQPPEFGDSAVQGV